MLCKQLPVQEIQVLLFGTFWNFFPHVFLICSSLNSWMQDPQIQRADGNFLSLEVDFDFALPLGVSFSTCESCFESLSLCRSLLSAILPPPVLLTLASPNSDMCLFNSERLVGSLEVTLLYCCLEITSRHKAGGLSHLLHFQGNNLGSQYCAAFVQHQKIVVSYIFSNFQLFTQKGNSRSSLFFTFKVEISL